MKDNPGREQAVTDRKQGLLFIVSAPSGAGKSTLCQAVLKRFPNLVYSVSYTTRSPRAGERPGRDYHFISREEFEKGIEEGRWAESARVHDHCYGTSAEFLDRELAAGRDILLDIDVQGTRQILKRFPQAITVFIMPPSMEALESRLRARGTDSDQAIALRLANAREEMVHKDTYRHVIINDRLPESTVKLIALLESYHA